MADQGHQGPLSRELGGQQGPPPGLVVSASLREAGPGRPLLASLPWAAVWARSSGNVSDPLAAQTPVALCSPVPAAGRGERGPGSGIGRAPARDRLWVRSIVHVVAAVAAPPQPQGGSGVLP